MADTYQSIIINKPLDHLADVAKLKSLDITPWWHLDKNGRHLAVESYDLGGFAHVCCLYSWTMLGVARGESLICTPYAKDLPVFVIDYSKKMSDETLAIEFFDNQIQPVDLNDVGMAAPRYLNLPAVDIPSSFPGLQRMNPSYAVKGKKCTTQMKDIADYTMRGYSQVLQNTPPCDESLKRNKILEHAEAYAASGCPNVEFYAKCIAEKDVPTFVSKCIFGLR